MQAPPQDHKLKTCDFVTLRVSTRDSMLTGFKVCGSLIQLHTLLCRVVAPKFSTNLGFEFAPHVLVAQNFEEAKTEPKHVTVSIYSNTCPLTRSAKPGS